MRLKIIACKVFYREISLLTANSKNIIDVTYIRQGLHDNPKKLKDILQGEITKIDKGADIYSHFSEIHSDFDAILLAYGLCSNSTAGIQSKKYPIVIPRAHDCITLLLGSKEKYKELFDANHGGIYWYSCGWIENSSMPGKKRLDTFYEKYLKKYGEKKAKYLLEAEKSWHAGYNMAAFINWKGIISEEYEKYAKECAEYLNWRYEVFEGDDSLMKRFIDGDWNKEDFLIVPPGHELVQSLNDDVIAIKS